MRSEKVEFEGHSGATLAARLDRPDGHARGTAVFAHCFTCSKDVHAARRIAKKLAARGIATLRFDFTGLGHSDGEFASTNFSSNAQDLKRACDWLGEHHEAPVLLVGHSLGGAAVLAVAGEVESVRAVATIGAPADVSHVLHNFEADLDRIEADGKAEVTLHGRTFTIEKQFVEDARGQKLTDRIAAMRKALLVLHSPVDATVGIDEASSIFLAAKHPKSFVSLDRADHLLSDADDSAFAAGIIAAFAARHLREETQEADLPSPIEHVRVSETGNGKFQQAVQAGRHVSLADEPESYGGLDSGPSPYDLVAAGLGACTAMTLRMYVDRKGLELGRVTVDVEHAKVHGKDCAECTEEQQARSRIDRFERRISVDGGVPEGLGDKLLEIADKCPVHRTLEHGAVVATRLDGE